jgi:4-amino-4-deoxy-L-arabinose transferase-like glycosyltransferase
MTAKIDIKKVVLFLIICISIVPLFNDLGKAPIEMWDEATYANNSIDMLEHPNLIIVSTEGVPETYSSKPPLVIWLQAISYKFFGVNEFGVRFPSAFMGLLTVVLLVWFCLYKIKNTILGIVSGLVLITSNGFMTIHATRTGDLDATLTFFSCLYSLLFLKYILFEEKRTKTIFWIVAGIVLAFLSKGTAGLFLIPFLILVALVNGSMLSILKDKRWYVAAGSVILFIFLYYFTRELMQPGYMQIVYKEEIGRFYSNDFTWLYQPFSYYYYKITEDRFVPYVFLIPLLPIAFFINKSPLEKKLLLFSMIIWLGHLLMISCSKVKLFWYDVIIYPFLSISIGLLISSAINYIVDKFLLKLSNTVKTALYLVIISSVFSWPYFETYNRTCYHEDIDGTYVWMKEGAYMRVIKEKFPEMKNYTVAKKPPNNELNDQIKFYQYAYKRYFQYNVQIKKTVSSETDKIVLTCQKELMDTIENSHLYSIIDSCTGCKLFQKNEIHQ